MAKMPECKHHVPFDTVCDNCAVEARTKSTFITIALPADVRVESLRSAVVKLAQAEGLEVRGEYVDGRYFFNLARKYKKAVAA